MSKHSGPQKSLGTGHCETVQLTEAMASTGAMQEAYNSYDNSSRPVLVFFRLTNITITYKIHVDPSID